MFNDIRAEFFPYEIINGIIAENCADLTMFWRQTGQLMKAIFPDYKSIGAYGYSLPEERQIKAEPLSNFFSQSHHEYHLFKTTTDEYIGYSYGNMRDAQTYFMTSSGILSSYRKRGLYSGYLSQLLRYLYALGYERVISNHHANNRPIIIAKLKQGFNISALNLDERWGAQVELTYHFYEDRRQVFQKAFSMEERNIPQSHLVSR